MPLQPGGFRSRPVPPPERARSSDRQPYGTAMPQLRRTKNFPSPAHQTHPNNTTEPTEMRVMTLYAPAEPTLVRSYTAPQQFCQPGEPTLVRAELAQEHPLASGESTVMHEYLAPQESRQDPRQSTVRTVGRIIDWIAMSLLALSVCAFICQQAFGAFRPVETAVTFPLDVAMAAVQGDQQEQYVGHTEWTK